MYLTANPGHLTAKAMPVDGLSRVLLAGYPPQQWKSLRTTNAIERLHGEFKRRVKTQCALPNAETAAMLFWALMASGQITMRRVGGWQTLDQAPVNKPIDLAACLSNHRDRELRQKPISTNYRTRPTKSVGVYVGIHES